MGVIDEIIKEPAGGAHRNHAEIIQTMKNVIRKSLKELVGLDKNELVARRYEKFRAMGKFLEIEG